MKFLIFLFAFQSTIIILCQIENVSGQRSIFDRDGQQYGATRYRRQKKSQRPITQQQYYASPNLINRPDAFPNSFYNRMPENENKIPDGVNSKRIKIDPTETGKTIHGHGHHHHHLHHLHNLHHGHHGHHGHQAPSKRRRPSYAAQSNPCYYRNARSTGPSQAQGRFFWDLNLYNVIPGTQSQYYDDDCGSFSSSASNYYDNTAGFGSRPPPYRPVSSGGLISNALPGLSNTGNGISPTDGGISSGGSINQNPDIYDPVFDDRPVYENQFASQPQVNMGPNLTPGQIVGGIAQTVNGVIQTLSGNSQQGQFLRTLYSRRRRYRN